jgi:hypothetical protein
LGFLELAQFQAVFDTVEANENLGHCRVEIVQITLHDMHMVSQTYEVLPKTSVVFAHTGHIAMYALQQFIHQLARDFSHHALRNL